MISVRFQGKPLNITVIQAYAPTSNAEENEVEWFYEDLQDLLELTPKKDVLFIIGDWNAKVGFSSRLKICSKPSHKQMCCHPGFAVPFTEHIMILKGPKFLRMVNEH